MTPIVYTIGKGSHYDNQELRWSLRSMEKHYGACDVIIVGHLPKWCKNVHHVEHVDTARKNFNIYAKTLAAFAFVDTLIQAADDHYVLADTDFTTYHHNGTLVEKNYAGQYGIITKNTAAAYPGGKFYNLHIPMLMTRERFNCLSSLDWDKKEYLVKSAYAYGLPSSHMDDVKVRGHVRTSDIKPGRFMSTSTMVPHDLRRWLNDRFPSKSRYE